ncbi:MAG: methionyl-tRNA formyltransferase [Phycisphaerae bacterium]
MRIIYAGSGHFAVPALRSIHAAGHEIAFVLTQPDRPAGRGKHPMPTPVRAMAQQLGLEVVAKEQVNSDEFVERVRSSGAVVGVVAAFGQKLGPDLLESLPAGWINIHASLLPAYRGAAPVHRAILDRVDQTGVTVFKLVERMDAGPILTVRRTGPKPDETTAELHDRLAAIGCDAVKAALPLFADGIPDGTPQDEANVTFAPKLNKTDGRIDFSRPAQVEAAHINGMWSWPGARCVFVTADGSRTEPVTLARARPAEVAESRHDPQPGLIDDRLYVAAGEGFVELLEIKPEGGRIMTWPEFVNGRHVTAGDRFEPTT